MIRYIEVEGATRPFLYSFRAIEEASKEGQVEGLANIQIAANLGFKYGALAEKKEVDFTPEDVGRWLDLDMRLMKTVKTAVKEAMQLFVETIREEEGK